jgi:transposase
LVVHPVSWVWIGVLLARFGVMKPPVRIRKLEAEEYHTLKKWSASRTLAAGRVKRAQIILLSNQGYIASEIAQALALCEKTVRQWIGRFNRAGLAGLEEKARVGRPPVYSTDEVATVLQLAQTPPQSLGLPFHFWTLDRLVAYLNEEKHIGIKRSRLSEIFQHEGLRWKQEEGWMGERVDPDFAQKRGPLNGSTSNHRPTALSSA